MVRKASGTSTADRRKDVLTQLLDAVDAGTAPWQKPWTMEAILRRRPRNVASGKNYRGINLFWLSVVQETKYNSTDGRWLTFNQVKDRGWTLRKGSHGEPVFYFSIVEKRDKETGETTNIPVLRYSTAFHASQVEGIPDLPEEPEAVAPERDETLERVISGSGAHIRYQEQDEAYYVPALDVITLPTREQFPTAEAFYGTVLHELGHWSGHESRLGFLKEYQGPFGSREYAGGELVAEMSAFMTAATLGTSYTPEVTEQGRGNSAAYLASWLKAVDDREAALNKAISHAGKSSALLSSFAEATTTDN